MQSAPDKKEKKTQRSKNILVTTFDYQREHEYAPTG